MNYQKKFLLMIVAIITVVSHCNYSYAALYQFDDVSGTSGVGAQWVGFLNYSPVYGPYPIEGPNSLGAPTTQRMQAHADLISNNNSIYLHSNINPLHTLYLVIPEGIGTLSTNFQYTGNLSAVTLGVYGGNFEASYPTIINYPTPGDGPSVNVDLTIQKTPGERTVYDSNMGELIFHQNPTTVPSQTLHIPFVIANVHDGSAQYAPLEMKITTRNTSGDIVGRRWFEWDVLSDKSVPADPVDWIFVPIEDSVIDRNEFMYNFTSEVTNHTGLRYGIQRYDDNRTLMAAHWKFDLQPISDRLPKILHLDRLSHIVPGLVTIYSHDAKVTVGQQKMLRLAAVDTTGEIIGSKLLELKYRTVYGYDLGSVQDTSTWTNRDSFWGLNAFRVYQSNRDFFPLVQKTMEIKSGDYFFPSRSSNVLQGNVNNTFPPVTADALSSFTLSAPVPLVSVDILSMDDNGDDVWISSDAFPDATAMLGVNVILRIPKTNRFIAEHWDSFAASRNLANEFSRYYSVWFRSPEGFDLNLSQYLKEEGKYDRTMKVFIDEENECITINYVTLFIEEGDGGGKRRPKIRIVTDVSTVNDYDYIVVNDGIDDGKWELIYYVAPAEATPPYPPYPEDPVSEDKEQRRAMGEGGGGGCSVLYIPFWILALFLLPIKRGAKIIVFSIALVLALSFASLAAGPPIPELVLYESDAATTGTLRYAISRINEGRAETDIILIDNLNRINLTAPLSIDADMTIEGNGASLSGNGTFRLFNVANGAKVNFRNLTFANGSDTSADINGGAVFTDSGAEVYFDKCTFTQNVASGDGGAVYSDGSSYFTNCTFYNNSSNGSGGAVYGGSSSTLSFSFVTMYLNECAAPNGGNAVNANGSDNIFQASIFSGNGGGEEVICSQSSRSLGYNVFRDSSFQGTDNATDLYDKSPVDIFGASPVLRRNEAAPGWRNWPYTVALSNRSGNPAMAIIPVSYIYSAGVLVDQRFIVRSNSNHPASAGSYEIFNPEAPVISLEIGGIPNGIAAIGFTAQLRSYALPESANPGVMWRSDDSSVVAITPSGRVYSVGSGVTLLRVISSGYDRTGSQISKAFFVKVGKDVTKSNIPPELANMISTFNNNVWGPEGVQFYLLGGGNDFSDPESFRQRFGKYPLVFDPIPSNSSVSSSASVRGANESIAIKPSVKFSVPIDASPEVGIVPFVLSISLSAKEISSVIGNSDFSTESFFNKAAFCTGANGENVLIDNCAKGLDAKEAENRGILSVKEDFGNVTFTLNGWFAATGETNSVVDGQLILSDEETNGFMNSELWLMALVNDGENSEESSSPGGCNTWFVGGIVCFVLVSLILGKKAKVFLLLSFMFLFGANVAFGADFSVSLNYSILQIVQNQPFVIIEATVSPASVSYGYKWETSDSGTVAVTSATTSTAGISGVSKGKATVTCYVTSTDNSIVTASCEVTVFETGMSGTSIIPSNLALYLGFMERWQLTPDHQPVGAEPINFTWSTDNIEVVSVDSNGNLLANKKGTATISYSAIAIPIGGGDPKSFDATCQVTVLKPVLSIDITQNPSPVIVGGRGGIIASYYPEDADSADIAWTSVPFDPSIVSIEPTSLTAATFNAIGFPAPNRTPGQNPVIVTASSVHWKNISFVPDVTCEIVIDPIQISDVSVIPSATSVVYQGDTVQFSQTVEPANATISSDFWDTSNRLVAVVSESGLVTGINQGQADISYTFNGWGINTDGTHSPVSRSAFSTVIVASPPSTIRVTDIDIEPTKLNISKGASIQLSAWVTPYYATNQTIHWSSGNLLVASVSSNGLVTARNPGVAYIYADPDDKGIDGTVGPVSCEVTVYDDLVIDDPAFVNIPAGLQNKIEQMNSALIREGLEVSFGFPLNKSKEGALALYGQNPILISKMDETTKVEIGLAKPISLDSMEPVTGSAEFIVDVSAYKSFGYTPILPVSLKMMVAKGILGKYLPQYSIGEVIANPKQYLTPLFSAFFFHKQIVDAVSPDLFVPLFDNPTIALEAERLGIITVKGIGDNLGFTLNYYVADSNQSVAYIIDGNLVIGDGTANGVIHDPVWILVRKTEEEKGNVENNEDVGKSEKSNGCNSDIGLSIVGFILIMLLRLIRKQHVTKT